VVDGVENIVLIMVANSVTLAVVWLEAVATGFINMDSGS
jgi:hypothetical protein